MGQGFYLAYQVWYDLVVAHLLPGVLSLASRTGSNLVVVAELSLGSGLTWRQKHNFFLISQPWPATCTLPVIWQ